MRRALSRAPSRYAELRELCAADIAHWQGAGLDAAAYQAQLEELNRSNEELFVFDIRDGRVKAREKPVPTNGTRHLQATRLPAYQHFFEQVVQNLAPELELSFGMLLEDLAVGDPRLPLVSFQKAAADRLLLVPELDSLVLNFYDSSDLLDELDFIAKRAAAVFVGSTTGVNPATGRSITITRESLDRAPPERIRAARRFLGRPHITFRLPGVVQCDGPDTEALLRSAEFCQGGPVSWKEQYRDRFIISIDGNGATCSRMALALRSRSVLLKYTSPYVLFYTRALKPFVHYLPVAEDDDVIRYVEELRTPSPGAPTPFLEIQQNANEFYHRYLARTAQHRYAAVLLNELQGLLKGRPLDVVRERIDTLDSPLDLMIHVSNQGDRWCWPALRAGAPGTGETIEAFAIRADLRIGSERDLECQCLYQDGSLGPWVPSGTLCGARGRGLPLAGFRLRLGGMPAQRHTLRYRASFVGEGLGPWIDQGTWCASPDRSALESLEIELAPRGLRRALQRMRAAWARPERAGASGVTPSSDRDSGPNQGQAALPSAGDNV